MPAPAITEIVLWVLMLNAGCYLSDCEVRLLSPTVVDGDAKDVTENSVVVVVVVAVVVAGVVAVVAVVAAVAVFVAVVVGEAVVEAVDVVVV